MKTPSSDWRLEEDKEADTDLLKHGVCQRVRLISGRVILVYFFRGGLNPQPFSNKLASLTLRQPLPKLKREGCFSRYFKGESEQEVVFLSLLQGEKGRKENIAYRHFKERKKEAVLSLIQIKEVYQCFKIHKKHICPFRKKEMVGETKVER